MQVVKKISTKTVGLGKRVLEDIATDTKAKDLPVLRVIANITSSQGDVSDYGPYIKFFGDVRATNLVTGEEFQSKQLLLPQVAEVIADAALNSVMESVEGDVQPSVDVAIDITISFNDSDNLTRFSYGAINLMGVNKEDRLSRIASALPKPKAMPKAIAQKKSK